jgi:hypothetical protein
MIQIDSFHDPSSSAIIARAPRQVLLALFLIQMGAKSIFPGGQKTGKVTGELAAQIWILFVIIITPSDPDQWR